MANTSENPLSTPKLSLVESKSKKRNENLKASREEESQKSDESFKSATEGEETVSSETDQVMSGLKITPETIPEVATNSETRFVLKGTMVGVETTKLGKVGESGAMVVWSEEFAGEEKSVREIGGSGSGETAEGLVQLGKENVEETVPFEQETLADLLKKGNKKRKTASSIPVETLPTRGRATRSQKKQSEAELENALEESKRKVVAKGKKKVVESVEVIAIDEIDLALWDEEETRDVETKSVEPSTLAKRTRSVLKSRKVKIVDEEWSGEEEEEEEEESDIEKDKMVKFGKRTILKGRLLRDLEEE
uniref:Eukaryotic translation initiation factor 5B-like n=1 Tax=Nicotiana sylvestris TaxID=4096 RepID=A0A1U7XZ45_NICSY|nr:PREDICTED: eukaryotic translation initiation factor 5B-like [Nicotiana sylvestris]